MDTLPSDVEALQALVRQLLDENAALKARVAELEARFQADSQNSHKPPSSDGLRKQPALPRPRGRKQGGQPGHHGKTLKLVEHPDRTVPCKPEGCSCGTSFQQIPGTVIERRQVFDVPEPKLDVTEYQRLRCQCPACGRLHEGVFPSHVKAPTQYGSGVRAFAALLNSGYLLPFKKIQHLFADLFGYAINEGTLVRANLTAYEALAPHEARRKAQLHDSPVCHFDETGIRVAGKLHWQHTVSNSLVTYLFVHPNRGSGALNSPASLFPTYHGWAMHDCWASYFRYASCRHALCGAHLLRELTAVAEQGSQWATQMHTLLLSMYRHAMFGTTTVAHPQRWAHLYDRVCHRAEREEPPPTRTHRRGKAHRTKGRNLLDRLVAYKPAVLAFAFHEEVPFTNNQAERDLRPVKVKQKIAGCFRTLVGAQHYARIAGFISTARKQQRPVFKELCQIVRGDSFITQSVGAK